MVLVVVLGLPFGVRECGVEDDRTLFILGMELAS